MLAFPGFTRLPMHAVDHRMQVFVAGIIVRHIERLMLKRPSRSRDLSMTPAIWAGSGASFSSQLMIR